MNGRIYDPTLGRFLQADPIIQAPKNSQSYNRYSYVLNNPLSFTDPSGYFFDKLFKGLNKVLGDFAPFISIALLFTPIGAWAATGLWQAATVGFVTGGIATGSLKGALIGAFSGAAFQHIGATFTEGGSGFLAEGGLGHIGSHAITGGISSVLQGGKFGHGFISAGLTKALNINNIVGTAAKDSGLRVAMAAIVGGTISKVTGGKFSNGAITAAFAQAFNGEQQARRARANEQRRRYFDRNSSTKSGVRVGLSAALKLPGVGAINSFLDEPTIPTGIEFQAHELRLPDGTVSHDFYPDLETGVGLELPNGLVSFDVMDLSTTTTVDVVFGLGVRIHFDQNFNYTGIGVAAGFGVGNLATYVNRFIGGPPASAVSISTSQDIRDF